MTTDAFTTAAHAEAKRRNPPIDRYPDDFTYPRAVLREHKRGEFEVGAEWARTHLATQEESVLMTSREETISDRLSDAGYTEYAEDEDGGVTWVSAPLGEVLRIVSAAQEPDDAEVEAAARAIWATRYPESRPDIAESTWADMTAPDDWTPEALDIMEEARVALSAARAARRDEEKR